MQFVQGFLLVSSISLFAFIGFYGFCHKKISGAKEIGMLMMGTIIWSIGSFFELCVTSMYWKVFWRNVQQIGVFSVPILTLYFVAEYTKKDNLKKLVYILTVFPIMSLLLIGTNEYHHLMRSAYFLDSSKVFGSTLIVQLAPLGSVLVGFNFLWPVIGVIILTFFVRGLSGEFRKQGQLIMISFFSTFLFLWIKTAFLENMGIYISLSVLYIPSTLILFYALFHYKFFDLSPIARDVVFEVVNQGIIVINNSGDIVDCNAYARNLFNEGVFLAGRKIGEIPNLKNIKDSDFSKTLEWRKMIYVQGEKRYFLISQYPLKHHYASSDTIKGIVLMINDITAQTEYENVLLERAERDSMTQLWNREGFIKKIDELQKQPSWEEKTISIFMMDLDFFKGINDTYGHLAGDKVLKLFADVMNSVLLDYGIFARIGGEEFAAVLPNLNDYQAFTLAEKLRETVSNTKLVVEDANIYFTVSIGIANYRSGKPDLQEMLKNADVALYKAKASGRNCCVVYEKDSF